MFGGNRFKFESHFSKYFSIAWTNLKRNSRKRHTAATFHCECKYFQTNRLSYHKTFTRDYSEIDSFILYVVVEGSGELHFGEEFMNIGFGDCLLVPASLTSVSIVPDREIKLLESFVPWFDHNFSYLFNKKINFLVLNTVINFGLPRFRCCIIHWIDGIYRH